MFSVTETSDKDLSWIDRSQYHLVRSLDDFRQLETAIEAATAPGLDSETEGLSTLAHQLVGVSISPAPEHAFYLPLRHRNFDNLDPALLPRLRDLLRRKSWVLFNASFDHRFFAARLDVEIDVLQDIQADMWLLDSDRGPSSNRKKLRLKHLVKEFLGFDQLELEDLLPQGVHDFSLVDDENDALLYAGADTDALLRLKKVLDPKLDAWKLRDLSRLEAKIAAPVADMERVGIDIDTGFAKTVDLAPELLALQDQISKYAEQPINANSPDQVAELLYDKLQLHPPKKDSRSVDEKALDRLKNTHPVVPLILDYRQLQKLKGAFLDKLEHVAAEDGRLHGFFISTGTRSSRFASSGGFGRAGHEIKVNGQQFPKSRKVNCRKILRATPGFWWMSSDFSQIEYRAIAYISQEPGLLEAYANNVDFHVKTASLMLRCPISEVDDAKRKKGKTINFAISFGMTDMGLALALGVPLREATALKDAYFAGMPRVARLIRDTKAFIKKNGYVRTEFGFVRHYDFTGLEADPKRVEALLMSGFNTRIQGTAATINKMAIVKLHKALKREYGNRARLLSTIHDEVNTEFANDIPVGEASAFVRETMSFKPGLKPGWLDFPVNISVGPSFGELVEIPPSAFASLKTLADVAAIVPANDIVEHTPTPRLVHTLPPRKVALRPPAVLLTLPPSADPKALESLREVADSNYGIYALYVRTGDATFLCRDITVNPSPAFLATVTGLGYKVETRKPSASKSFDTASLSF